MKVISFDCNFDEINDVDVIHVVYWYGLRGAIQKVVDNISKHTPNMNHCVLTLSDFNLQTHVVAEIINMIKPRIIHVHINTSYREMGFLDMINYKPFIVQTVHHDYTSQFHDKVDKIVCIHRECHSKNSHHKHALIIENTVDVSGLKKYTPNSNGICSHFRFAPERFRKSNIQLYKQLSSDVSIYGRKPPDDHNLPLYQMANGSNIKIKDWSICPEKDIIKHSLYLYYIPNNNHLLCYGLSLMEAVALGMPVVASQRCQVYQKYVDIGINGLICQNESQFVEKINNLLADEIMFEDLCYGAMRKSKKLLNTMPLQYQAIYEMA